MNAGKPSLNCFDKIAAVEGCALGDLVYVGDDPNKDFVSLRANGATTIRVHTGKYKDSKALEGFDAEFHLLQVSSLPILLDSIFDR
jgi:putative hydrolase of the HAD superfamily